MVIYFSGTGNSRYVAEGVAQLTGDECVNMADHIKKGQTGDFQSEKPYVFVTPTYAWRIPKVAASFIENSRFSGSKAAYVVQTCGDSAANSAKYAEKLCKKCGFDYRGFAFVFMPENYIAMFEAPDKQTASSQIEKAEKYIRSIAEAIAEGKTLSPKPVNGSAKLMSSVVNPFFYMSISAKGFSVSDQCVGCGKCVEACPMGNVKLADKTPVWGKNCTHCMGCICSCPAEAIEYKKKTAGKTRFYNTKSPDFK